MPSQPEVARHDLAHTDAPLKPAAYTHGLCPSVEPQRHWIDGHTPVPPHQHHASRLGSGRQLVDLGAAGERLCHVVADRRGGIDKRLADPRSVGLGGSNRGREARDISLLGGAAQVARGVEQSGSPSFSVAQVRVERR